MLGVEYNWLFSSQERQKDRAKLGNIAREREKVREKEIEIDR